MNPNSSYIEKTENGLPDFCPDLEPEHPKNILAGRLRGLNYDPLILSFVDSYGKAVRDCHGKRYE